MDQEGPNMAEEEKDVPSLFARNLRVLRRVKGVSQQLLAQELELKRNNIASYEAGIVEPKPERLLAIARFFQIDPVLLLTEDLSRDPNALRSPLSRDNGENVLAYKLTDLSEKTADLQKVLEGFKAFYEIRKKQLQKTPEGSQARLQSLSNDLENLMEIIRTHLDANWEFLDSIRK